MVGHLSLHAGGEKPWKQKKDMPLRLVFLLNGAHRTTKNEWQDALRMPFHASTNPDPVRTPCPNAVHFESPTGRRSFRMSFPRRARIAYFHTPPSPGSNGSILQGRDWQIDNPRISRCKMKKKQNRMLASQSDCRYNYTHRASFYALYVKYTHMRLNS
jgi:hypothetical protein